ncbi:hypothetical protein AB0M43_35485 [Longispora sp. NPDC051575]|uniref:hypothetical protein n=1 Tax=Longispora sp. NPDC051575 TaxID=3154943 RepID=UPI00342FA005
MFVLLGGALPAAVWLVHRVVTHWRRRAAVEPTVFTRRRHGTLSGIVDSDRRQLRPIGASIAEVAVRTDILLESLLRDPRVRLFRGLRTSLDEPPVTHALVAGRSLTLIESVAWPPGAYLMDPDGRIRCEDAPIGQSVEPLRATVRRLRRELPRGHRVAAMVVVHRTGPGGQQLPLDLQSEVTFTGADEAVSAILGGLPRGGRADWRTLTGLVAATGRAVEGLR